MGGQAVYTQRTVGRGAALACAALAALATSSCGMGASRSRPAAEPAPARRPAPDPTLAPPPSGEPRPHVILHTVRRGETLWRIARFYGADVEEMIVVNNLEESARIETGQALLVPAPHRWPASPGPLPAETLEPPDGADPGAELTAVLRWPLHGAVQSRFGPRGRRHHDGVDIDGRMGDPIRAAADGQVRFSGTWGAYGKTIVIDHGGGLSTLYAHASDLKARLGERVRSGEAIARVGRSGNARGPHLHFEVRRQGRPVDPLSHLPAQAARAAAR
jgi:murein DD-endopeptidase MepM/ murein hydrolase activator NlpD